MKRLLLPSNAFVRSARRLARKHPQLAPELELTLELLAEDAFHPQLKTHKLKGKLAGSWACSAGYAQAASQGGHHFFPRSRDFRGGTG